jgi:hypothetical protein
MKNIFKLLLVLVGLMLMLVLSELAFMWKQGEFSKVSTFIRLKSAQRLAANNKVEQAWERVNQAAGFHLWYIHVTRYGNRVPMGYEIVIDSSIYRKEITDLISDIEVSSLVSSERSNLAWHHYNLAVKLWYNSDDSAEYLFQKAVFLAPELSHYHVELANYYLNRNLLRDKAIKALAYCGQFEAPKEHCRDFEGNVIRGEVQPVGFLMTTIDEYYVSLAKK